MVEREPGHRLLQVDVKVGPGAEDVFLVEGVLVVLRVQVDDVPSVENLLPDGEGEAVGAELWILDAGVVRPSELAVDNTLNNNYYIHIHIRIQDVPYSLPDWFGLYFFY